MTPVALTIIHCSEDELAGHVAEHQSEVHALLGGNPRAKSA